MRKFDVQIALEGIAEARERWDSANKKFKADVEYLMTRLLNEAAVNHMSAEEIAKASGLTVKRVRALMRKMTLDPKKGKRLLAKQAAETLAENAALLGIEPHEMDLMSPLAYLPMGEEMRRKYQNQTVSQVTDEPVSRNTVEIDAGHMTRLEALVVRSEGIAPVSVQSLVGMAIDGFLDGAE